MAPKPISVTACIAFAQSFLRMGPANLAANGPQAFMSTSTTTGPPRVLQAPAKRGRRSAPARTGGNAAPSGWRTELREVGVSGPHSSGGCRRCRPGCSDHAVAAVVHQQHHMLAFSCTAQASSPTLSMKPPSPTSATVLRPSAWVASANRGADGHGQALADAAAQRVHAGARVVQHWGRGCPTCCWTR
jgi:hypothetical protein